jgi:hypothetical protein
MTVEDSMVARGFVACLTFLFIAGCTSAPYQVQEPKPWDGGWRLDHYECNGGKLSDSGSEMNRLLESAINNVMSMIRGAEVVTYAYDYDASGRTLMRCETTLHEKWSFDGKASVTISDSAGSSVLAGLAGSANESFCPREVRNPAPRTHGYELTRNQLRMKLSDNGHVISGEPDLPERQAGPRLPKSVVGG